MHHNWQRVDEETSARNTATGVIVRDEQTQTLIFIDGERFNIFTGLFEQNWRMDDFMMTNPIIDDDDEDGDVLK